MNSWIAVAAVIAVLSAQEPGAKPRPAWLHEMPVVLVSNHDSIEVSAPATVVAEPMRQPRANRLLLHLLNYDVARTASLNNLEAEIPASAEMRERR